MAASPYSQSYLWIYIQQTRYCSSLERIAYELGTQRTTPCRWSSMATETPKWVKDLRGQGRWIPLWHIRDNFEQILFHSSVFHHPLTLNSQRFHLNARALTCSENVFVGTTGWNRAEKSSYFNSHVHCLSLLHFSLNSISLQSRISARPLAFVFVLTLASDFPWEWFRSTKMTHPKLPKLEENLGWENYLQCCCAIWTCLHLILLIF